MPQSIEATVKPLTAIRKSRFVPKRLARNPVGGVMIAAEKARRTVRADPVKTLTTVGLAVIGAGNMLSSQAISAGLPLVVSAVGGADQPRRIRQLSRSGLALAAQLEPEALCVAAAQVLDELQAGRREHRTESMVDGRVRVARRLRSLARSQAL